MPYTRNGKALLRRKPDRPGIIHERLRDVYMKCSIKHQPKHIVNGQFSWAATFLTVPPRSNIGGPILPGRLTERQWKRAATVSGYTRADMDALRTVDGTFTEVNADLAYRMRAFLRPGESRQP